MNASRRVMETGQYSSTSSQEEEEEEEEDQNVKGIGGVAAGFAAVAFITSQQSDTGYMCRHRVASSFFAYL
jgi:hypothetical protein